jgi:hypothetical protein
MNMSRSGYTDGWEDNWQTIMWRGAVESAFRGRRGQAFLKEMLEALDALPEKKLVDSALEENGAVCAMGAVGKKRGVDMSKIDPEDSATVAGTFNIAEAMAREIAYENDECFYNNTETPEKRFQRMRSWVESRIKT